MATKHRSAKLAFVLPVLFVVLLLVGSCGAVGVATTTLSGCKRCHFDDRSFEKATLASSHSTIECVRCHVDTKRVASRAKFGLYQAFGMWLPMLDPGSSDVAAVPDERCLGCHASIQAKVVNANGLRIKHSSCGRGRNCVDCHSQVAHGAAIRWARVASMDDCVACHRSSKSVLTCEGCHTGKIDRQASSGPAFTVTHGPNWRETHGMGQMSSCTVCHDESACERCHGPGVPHTSTFVQDHGTLSERPDAKCTTCHDQKFCYDCHQTEMPHKPVFASAHSFVVVRDGERLCLRCHDKSDCDTCHVKHVHPGGAVGPIPSPKSGGN